MTVERPSYDLTIFKVHCGELALKIYSKGERVLRAEAMARNVEALKCGRSLERFPRMVPVLKKRSWSGSWTHCLAWINASSRE